MSFIIMIPSLPYTVFPLKLVYLLLYKLCFVWRKPFCVTSFRNETSLNGDNIVIPAEMVGFNLYNGLVACWRTAWTRYHFGIMEALKEWLNALIFPSFNPPNSYSLYKYAHITWTGVPNEMERSSIFQGHVHRAHGLHQLTISLGDHMTI